MTDALINVRDCPEELKAYFLAAATDGTISVLEQRELLAAGAAAFVAGFPEHDCPALDGNRHRQVYWRVGWRQAQRTAEAQKQRQRDEERSIIRAFSEQLAPGIYLVQDGDGNWSLNDWDGLDWYSFGDEAPCGERFEREMAGVAGPLDLPAIAATLEIRRRK